MSFIPFKSRFKAGKVLADIFLDEKSIKKEQNLINNIVFTIPNGGVPVAEAFCECLNFKYRLMIVRKIKIPYNPEAGFGSITTDGTVIINKELLSGLSLSNIEIERSIEITKMEIKNRLNFYNILKTPESSYKSIINDKTVFIMDDGLASGFTMLAGIKMIKKYFPKKIIIAVPTAPYHTIEYIKKEVDKIICPNIRKTHWFAVADAYKHWYDVSDSEVLNIIKKSNNYLKSL